MKKLFKWFSAVFLIVIFLFLIIFFSIQFYFHKELESRLNGYFKEIVERYSVVEVKSVQVKIDLIALLKGHLTYVDVVLGYQNYDLSIKGPISWKIGEIFHRIEVDGEFLFKGQRQDIDFLSSLKAQFKLDFDFKKKLIHFAEFNVNPQDFDVFGFLINHFEGIAHLKNEDLSSSIKLNRVKNSQFGLKLIDFSLKGEGDFSNFAFEFLISKLEIKDRNQMVSLKDIHFNTKINNSMEEKKSIQFQFGLDVASLSLERHKNSDEPPNKRINLTVMGADLKSQFYFDLTNDNVEFKAEHALNSLEVLIDETYLDIPMKDNRLFYSGVLDFSSKQDIQNFVLEFKHFQKTWVQLKNWRIFSTSDLVWPLGLKIEIDLNDFFGGWGQEVFNFDQIGGVFKANYQGFFNYKKPMEIISSEFNLMNQFLSLEKGEILFRPLQVYFQNIDFLITRTKKKGFNLHIEQFSGLFKKLKFSFKDLILNVENKKKIFAQQLKPVTIELAHKKVELVDLYFEANPFRDSLEWFLRFPFKVDDISIKKMSNSFCIDPNAIPEGSVSIDFDSIVLSPLGIEIKGDLYLHVFGGQVKTSHLRFLHLGQFSQEIQFSSYWRDLDLKKVGSFLKFGEMDGKINGYLRDVIFYQEIPRSLDFKIELSPNKSKEVVFSPQAMKNFVQLFSPEDFTQNMPQFINWLAFGWPSEIIGGYNIKYAGLSVYSSGQSLLVETLDPAEIVEQEKKRFILYGRRFKIPLKSVTYPVVLDVSGMLALFRHILWQLEGLKQSQTTQEQSQDPVDGKSETKKQKKEEDDETSKKCFNY